MYFLKAKKKSVRAWASKQSSVIESRKVLIERLKKYEKKFEKIQVNRPPYWVGIKIIPKSLSFGKGISLDYTKEGII